MTILVKQGDSPSSPVYPAEHFLIPQFQGRRRFRIVLEAARIRNPCGKVGKLHIRIVENLSVKHRLPVRRRDSLRRN